MKLIPYVSALAIVAAFQAASAADITGKVTLKGSPPPEKVLPLDPSCGKVAKADAKTRFYVAGQNGALADVVVYISKGVPADKKFEPPAEPLVIDQKGCEFHPYVAAVMAKQKIQIKNSDPFLHNVNHAPTADVQKRSPNVAQLPGGPIVERAFEKQEDFLIRFKCDVHPWMFSYVAVFEHPYFAVTGEDGAFKIGKLPPGTYTIEAFHRKAGKLSKEITVTDANQTVDFTLEVK